KGALYHHFTTKNDLGLAALEYAAAQFSEFLDDALEGRSGLAALESLFDAAVDVHRRRGFVGGCPFGNLALEMADSDPRYTRTLLRVFDTWISRIGDVVVEGQQAGEMRTDIPPARLARLIVAALEGGIMMSRLSKDDRPMSDCAESLRTMLATASSETGRSSAASGVTRHGRPLA
ncbi:MAG: TetR family transcriptional regulator C-terminal domain-containing protein, partial [Armatimonadota bacterium]